MYTRRRSCGMTLKRHVRDVARAMSGALLRIAREPLDDYFAAIDRLRDARVGIIGAFAQALVAIVATWFAYVPVHELLHAWGCLVAGGSVTRLDIAPEYGGRWLATIFPYVRSGSEYAGQLSGFDTHGSDLTYLSTVLAPYLLTMLIGVPLLKWAGGSAGVSMRARPVLLGVAIVLAYAPIISLTGDYYEAGSIVVTRAAQSVDSTVPLARWRSDDLPKLVSSLHSSGATIGDWIGVAISSLTGLLFAWLTYRVGGLLFSVARRFLGTGPTISDSPSRHDNS